MDIYLYQGGSLVAQKVVSVTIAAINDDPVWTGPTSRTTDEAFSGTEISLSDVDSQSSLLTVTVEVDYGVVQRKPSYKRRSTTLTKMALGLSIFLNSCP
mmetsp:Transcript_419/g.588  ORF Transcript_419/g.588 Transcript_419/m.588 type:complete len:99 (+) Transcript_419:78-374(+)